MPEIPIKLNPQSNKGIFYPELEEHWINLLTLILFCESHQRVQDEFFHKSKMAGKRIFPSLYTVNSQDNTYQLPGIANYDNGHPNAIISPGVNTGIFLVCGPPRLFSKKWNPKRIVVDRDGLYDLLNNFINPEPLTRQ